MTSDRSRWDERYHRVPAPAEPSLLLIEFASLIRTPGLALDLACGGGRNSVFLAELGLHVLGADRSRSALEQGRSLALRRGVEVAWLQADLERIHFPPGTFKVILCFFYHVPALYEQIRIWLQPGGLLLYETYTREQWRFGVGPKNPAHLLETGELLVAFADWEVIFSREAWHESGVASLVARKPMP